MMLRSQVSLLMEQCQQKGLQAQLYKQKLDETWLIVRDEAAKCKAAKDIIKVLTNQCTALSEKLLVSNQLENYKITPDNSPGQPLTADLQYYPNKNLATGEVNEPTDTQNFQISSQLDNEYIPSSNYDFLVDRSHGYQNGARTFDNGGYIMESGAVAPVTQNGLVEQIERGVYVTFALSPSGRKDIRRVRFSILARRKLSAGGKRIKAG
ncbi:hypothetical protein ACP70R_010193 [Stipagrostis hirtigluma subsp. patula]